MRNLMKVWLLEWVSILLEQFLGEWGLNENDEAISLGLKRTRIRGAWKGGREGEGRGREKMVGSDLDVLADIPTSPRFDILKALIANSNSSSMTAILVDCVREEMRMENCQRISVGHDEFLQAEKSCQSSLFWSADVLELVELILRPPKGGPPALPEDSDAVFLSSAFFEIPKIVMNSVALFETDLLDTFPYQPLVNASANACWIHLHIFLLVLSALNLYRFVLITESTVLFFSSFFLHPRSDK
ncbi:hypothetical protein CK203_088576 [Vitis vinifera]|uniref:Uncharacterized protein n=1 Tax=Vitis vinifera TaxID=29760 RepID=A0A438F1H9_VITVI|nr:hypothetical protein CK203_088576 [Vitis vinifera]